MLDTDAIRAELNEISNRSGSGADLATVQLAEIAVEVQCAILDELRTIRLLLANPIREVTHVAVPPPNGVVIEL